MLPSKSLLSHLVPNCHLPGMLRPTSGILHLPLHLLGSCQDGIHVPPSQVDSEGEMHGFQVLSCGTMGFMLSFSQKDSL